MTEECIPFLALVCKTEAVELKARPAERESSRQIEKTARRGQQFFFSHPTHKNPAWPFLAALSASAEHFAALPYPYVAPPPIKVDQARAID